MTAKKQRGLVYVCVNLGETCVPEEIEERSVCIDGDIGEILKKLK